MGWTEIENAIMVWVRATTGFDGSHVILAKQNGTKPNAPYVDVGFDGPFATGGPKQNTTDYDATRAAGSEIRTTINQHAEIIVSLDVHTVSGNGTGCARDLAAQLVTAAKQSITTRDAFAAAGLAFKTAERVHDLTGVLNTAFEGRARVEVTFNVLETLIEYGTFIESVSAINDLVANRTLLLQ